MTAEEISAAAGAAGVTLGQEAAEGFATYLELLLRWNTRLNLTAVRAPEQIVQRHFVECIFAASMIPSNIKTFLDFGSGAGFPGIPVALCTPEISVTLAESQGKKAAFLQEVIRTLGVKAEVFAGRVESMDSGRIFDAVALRAVDKMGAASEAAVAKVAPGGWMMIFATRGTEDGVRELLPEIAWQESAPVPGMGHGVLMMGIRQ